MGFIAYSHNLENTAKLLTFSKLVQLKEQNDRNRVFVTGQTLMTGKFDDAGGQTSSKICEQLESVVFNRSKIRRVNLLDKNSRHNLMKKMKDYL